MKAKQIRFDDIPDTFKGVLYGVASGWRDAPTRDWNWDDAVYFETLEEAVEYFKKVAVYREAGEPWGFARCWKSFISKWDGNGNETQFMNHWRVFGYTQDRGWTDGEWCVNAFCRGEGNVGILDSRGNIKQFGDGDTVFYQKREAEAAAEEFLEDIPEDQRRLWSVDVFEIF